MPSKARLVAIACAFVFLAVFAAPAVRADMDRPTWTAGDFWQYAFTGDIFGAAGSGGMRIEVVGPDSTTVGTNTYPTYRARTWINITSGGVTLSVPGDAWFRTTDLALVRQTMSISFGPFSTTTTVTYDPPEEIRWPLRAGVSWSATSTVRTVTDGSQFTDTETMSFIVQAETPVTVPAGTFTTTPLRREPGGGYRIEFWSPQVGNSVRSQEYDSGGSQQTSADLQAYKYQGGSLLGNLWLILLLLLIVIVIVVAAVLARRRRGPAAPMPSGWQQPGMPPQQQPWQAPPQQPWQPPQQPPPSR
jgi:hypothetical protein